MTLLFSKSISSEKIVYNRSTRQKILTLKSGGQDNNGLSFITPKIKVIIEPILNPNPKLRPSRSQPKTTNKKPTGFRIQ